MKHLFFLFIAFALMGGEAIADSICVNTQQQLTDTRRPRRPSRRQRRAAAEAEQRAAEQRRHDEEARRPDIDRPGLLHVTKKNGDWMMQLPDSLLGKPILASTRFISTPAESGKYGGEQCCRHVVYFELNPDSTLLLRSSMMINYADSTDQISRAVNISNEDPIIGAFSLERGAAAGTFKFKVNSFFNSDNALALPSSSKNVFSLGSLDREASYISDIRSFPTNTEVQLVRTYNSSGRLPSARTTGKVTLQLNISFVLLPETPMLGRFYDPRVGYFTESFNVFSDQQQHVEEHTFISRWRLEPRPEDVERMRRGELVEPIKPIVYYIDPATPQQWRKYLIQGVNDWQVAFERAGFRNAIRAEEWPENDSTMSMEDARYSVIRYLASDIPNAYGPHISDPRTGEILESHIGWYHNVMSLVHEWYMIQASSIDEAARQMHFDEELMGQLIRFVSSHEVGHTLGLRHNFGASSTVPVDSLRSKAWVEAHGHTPSIMDYARFNYVAQPEDSISTVGIFPRIGDYDLWAIEWGYRPMLDATDSYDDHRQLEPLVKRSQRNPRLWWGDGEGVSWDPRRQTEDLGDDPVLAGRYGIMNLRREMAQLQAWTRDERDIYDRNLYRMYREMQTQYMRYIGHAAKYVGGTYINWRLIEDGGTRYQPTPLDRQREALNFVNDYALQEPIWMREFSYCRMFTDELEALNCHMASTAVQYLTQRLFNYINILYPAERFADDLVRMCFSETTTGARVTPYRERVQTTLVNTMLQNFSDNNSTTRQTVLYTLNAIQRRLTNATSSDAHTRAHYANLKDLINRRLTIR